MGILTVQSKQLSAGQRTILTRDGWLSLQSLDFQDSFLALGTVKQFEAGYCLYALDSQVSHVYGLIDGQIDVHLLSSTFEEIAFPSTGRGKWYSFSDAITGDRTAGTAILKTQSTMFCIPRAKFLTFLDVDPTHYRAIISHDNILRRHIQRVLMDALTGSEVERVVIRLQALVDGQNTDVGTSLKLTQTELAAMAGVSLPTVQRTFRLLKKFEAVETTYGEIQITDREKLSQLQDSLEQSKG
ncbi:MAG: Crp/Fnr family transcriptional regulator [Tateyamaria sp.]|uniref:Crp/Fnr family transcriptional regulator n=1 Tax=Tateyamaria sp. TaxID=1929288 RepID=UPI00328CBCAA